MGRRDVVAVRAQRIALVAPSVFWLEVGIRLGRARRISEEFALEAMIRAEVFEVETAELERPQRVRALQLSHDHRLSMYDGAHLAAADATRSPLLTLDERLATAARSLGLGPEGNSGTGASEPAAPYRDGPVDKTSIAAIGAALAQMRKEYSL